MKQTILDKRSAGLAMALVLSMMVAGNASAGGTALVTNADDSGPGSLRHALEVRQASRVVIAPWVGNIEILSTLEYSNEKPLSIRGKGQTVQTGLNVTLLAVTEGADLKISDLHFSGPGGYSINARGDQGTSAGKGIFVDLREDQQGTLKVDLKKVSVSGVANHGIHVSDCSLADDCGGGSGGGGEGSPASILVKLDRVKVEDVGNGKFDADGLRIDERGDGDIVFSAKTSSFNGVGADGVELDEGNEGDVFASVWHSDFSDNGIYCDPDLLGPFLPAEDEGEFDEADQVSETDIPGPVTGSPDDSCFEREVSLYEASGFVEEYEFAIDVDDGFDIDEAGNGFLVASLKHVNIERNLDEGMDFDEAGPGSVLVDLYQAHAAENVDDGFKVSEEDEGAVVGKLRKVTSRDNGGKGIVFEEEDEGDLLMSVVRTNTANNDDSDDTGLEAAQDSPGVGKLRLRSSDIADGLDLDGVDLE